MACPFFDPSSPQAGTSGSRDAMLPLGDVWAGVCRAIPGPDWKPQLSIARPLCNLGYARGQCDRFPAAAGPDAVRFTISADSGVMLRLLYVVERDHQPFAHGPLEYSLSGQEFATPLSDGLLESQARAYIASYLRRRAEANGS